MSPRRRQVLAASAVALLAGCLDQESQPEDENGDDENSTPDEELGSGELLDLQAYVIEDVPSSIDPIPSDDNRVDGVGLFPELFEKLTDEDHERSTVRSAEYGEFETVAIREVSATSEAAEATRGAYDDLPRESPEGLPRAPYLEHEGSHCGTTGTGTGGMTGQAIRSYRRHPHGSGQQRVGGSHALAGASLRPAASSGDARRSSCPSGCCRTGRRVRTTVPV